MLLSRRDWNDTDLILSGSFLSCSFGGFFDVLLRSGALFSSRHNFTEQICPVGSSARRESRYVLAATLSSARCFLRSG